MERNWIVGGVIALVTLLVIAGSLAVANGNLRDNLQDQTDKVDTLSDNVETLEADVTHLTEQLEVALSELDNTKNKLEASEEEVARLTELLENDNDSDGTNVPVDDEPVGEVLDELLIGETVEFVLDDNDLEQLRSGEVRFDGDEYDYEEEIFSTSDLILASNGLGYDEEFGDAPRLITVDEGAIGYRVVFEDAIPVDEVSFDETLEVPFLGGMLEIVAIDGNEIDFLVGTSLDLVTGEVVETNGVELELLGVSENEKIQLRVDDTIELLDVDDVEMFGDVEVRVVETFYNTQGAQFARVVVGSLVDETQDNNDEYILDENFMFSYVINNANELEEIKLVFDVKSDEVDDVIPAVVVGDAIVFPNGFFSVTFEEVTDVSYFEYVFSLDDKDAEDDLVADENVLVVEGETESIVVDGEEVDEVYFTANGDIYFYNDDDEFTLAQDSYVVFENDDYEAEVSYGNNELQVLEESNGLLSFAFDVTNLRLGMTEEDAEGADVTYEGANYGTSEYDVLTADGLVILDVEQNADDDEVVLAVPSDVLEGTVVVA